MPALPVPSNTPSINDDDIWTSTQLAAFLQVSNDTLKYWRGKGKGPRFFSLAAGSSSKVFYRKADVEDWLRTIPLRQRGEKRREA